MARVISPPKDELKSLRQPLTEGEWRVLDFFDAQLGSEWEIYLQPHLNGLRPDFVILHPDVGVGVFEVKDWKLDSMRRWVAERPDRSPVLMGEKDGRTFSLQHENPIEKLRLYKEEIRDIYCPRLGHRAGLAVVSAGAVFPFAASEDVRLLLGPLSRYWDMNDPRYYPVAGADELKSGNLSLVFPEGQRKSSYYMSADLAADLRNWLVEPDAASTQRTPLALDREQERLATTRTDSTGYRRIKGPAGSGKSMVLAARAADLVAHGKHVLVATFNVTLRNYLQDLAVRRYPRARKEITWLNFHEWCKRVCWEGDRSAEYRRLWRDYFERCERSGAIDNKIGFDATFDRELCGLVALALEGEQKEFVTRFDAVLVDEGQDFHPAWWNVLRKACSDGGEMLLVADSTQDVYGTATAWTDEAMRGAGFRGDWSQLATSYRLPIPVVHEARRFAEAFLPSESRDLPQVDQLDLGLSPCTLRWVQTAPEIGLGTGVSEMMRLVAAADPAILPISDITLLVESQSAGLAAVGALERLGVQVTHTFGADRREQSGRKKYFFMGAPMPKVTTLHSFKGWEARAVVMHIEHAARPTALALVYTGLTRLKRHESGSFLTVVCSAPELAEYGRSWPEFQYFNTAPPPLVSP